MTTIITDDAQLQMELILMFSPEPAGTKSDLIDFLYLQGNGPADTYHRPEKQRRIRQSFAKEFLNLTCWTVQLHTGISRCTFNLTRSF